MELKELVEILDNLNPYRYWRIDKTPEEIRIRIGVGHWSAGYATSTRALLLEMDRDTATLIIRQLIDELNRKLLCNTQKS